MNESTRQTQIPVAGEPASTEPDLTHSVVVPPSLDNTKRQSIEEMTSAIEKSLTLPVLDGYLIEEQIGEGGMGVVYRAMQHKLNRVVALKMVIGGKTASSKDLIRFLAEAEAVASIDHPYVISVYEFGDADGRPYLAMEYLSGGSLTDRLRAKGGRLEPREAAELLRKLAQAAQAAHDMQIVHRDLKPSNILFDANGEPRITDFGLAKRAGGSDLTGTIAIMGTASYMAPEQARGESKFVGPAADIWALGVILYECLAGSRPFTGMNELEVLRSVAERDPTVIRNRLPSVALDLDLIAQKCLSKKTTDRYLSANDLAEDLRRWLAGEPVSVKQAGPIERLVKWVRRNKVAAGIIVASLLGTALATSLAIYAYSQRKRADEEASIAQAVNDFVQNDILDQADSRQQAERKFKPDPDLKVRTALDRAAENVGKAFENKPETEFAIRRTIGNAYRSVGETTKAIENLSRSYDLALAKYGPEHPETLKTLSDLAMAFQTARKTEDAVTRLLQVRDYHLKKHGPDHPQTLQTQMNLAQVYQDAGRFSEAITLYEQVRDTQAKTLPPEHGQFLKTLNDLATAYQDAGRLKEAIPIFEQIRDTQLKSAQFGPEHPFTLTVLNNLATVYTLDDRWTEAVKLFEQVAETRTKILGPDHPETLATLNNLAMAIEKDGRLPEAVRIYEKIRDVQMKSKDFGPSHPDTLRTLTNLAYAYRDTNRNAEAEKMFEQVRNAWLAIGVDHPETLNAQHNLAFFYLGVGRTKEAIAIWEDVLPRARKPEPYGPTHPRTEKFTLDWISALEKEGQTVKALEARRDLLAIQRRIHAADSPRLATMLAYLGNGYLVANSPGEAEPLILESLTIRQAKAPDEWTTFNTQSLLGESLTRQKKYADAEPLLLSGYEGVHKRVDKIPAEARALREGQTVDRLIAFYQATSKPDDVKKWQAVKDGLAKTP